MLVQQNAVHIFVRAVEDAADDRIGCGCSEAGTRNVSHGNAVMQIGGRMVAILIILRFGARVGQRGGLGRDGGGDAGMQLAILLVSRDLALCVAQEGNRLTSDGGELIDRGGVERILGIIQHGKKAVAGYDFDGMAGGIAVGANVVRQVESGRCLRACATSHRKKHQQKTQRAHATASVEHDGLMNPAIQPETSSIA